MVDDEQHHPQEEADRAHSDVSDPQEGVLAPHPGDGAQDHTLPPLKATDRVVWDTLRRNLSMLKMQFLSIVRMIKHALFLYKAVMHFCYQRLSLLGSKHRGSLCRAA